MFPIFKKGEVLRASKLNDALKAIAGSNSDRPAQGVTSPGRTLTPSSGTGAASTADITIREGEVVASTARVDTGCDGRKAGSVTAQRYVDPPRFDNGTFQPTATPYDPDFANAPVYSPGDMVILFAEAFDESVSYGLKWLVLHNGGVYLSNTAGTSVGAFPSAEFDRIGDLGELFCCVAAEGQTATQGEWVISEWESSTAEKVLSGVDVELAHFYKTAPPVGTRLVWINGVVVDSEGGSGGSTQVEGGRIAVNNQGTLAFRFESGTYVSDWVVVPTNACNSGLVSISGSTP